MSTVPSPNAEYTKEVRFAVVMYGGVSLAIYINGVAQELLRMVRSTSQSEQDSLGNPCPIPVDKLTGTERVYRRLSYLLSDPDLLSEFRESLESDQELPPADDLIDKRMSAGPINTRFVVDIMSGTSAGGINAIYLAKALANDQKLDELKQLWVSEGDIALLINDKKSTMGLHLANQDPPQSLLNSRRMYLKLLRALQTMESIKPSRRGLKSPHVDELDLFITTTDIQGLTLPLRLSDTIVYEKRHRNVFHFKYEAAEATGRERNDFLGINDPFLAFTARCTSSFPFAFEPMRLCDIDEVLNLFPQYRNDKTCRSDSEHWKAFFRDNVGAETGKTVDFTDRSFGDGGYLDNKPFTFATETLSRRDAPVLVDRKLIYIEPSPEHPEDDLQKNIKPQALANVKAALLDLPTHETIREDLQRLMDRNGLLKRVNRITRDIENDLNQSGTERPSLKEGQWATLDLADMTEHFGVYYIPYRRLRISDTTDQLAKVVARARDLDETSAHVTAIRFLIRAWRERNYPDYKSKAVPGTESQGEPTRQPSTVNQFLGDFDFKYWLRRLTFVRSKVDQLYKLGRLPTLDERGRLDPTKISEGDESAINGLKRLTYRSFDYSTLSTDERLEIQKLLSFLKCELNEIFKQLRVAGRLAQSKPTAGASTAQLEFAKSIGSIKLSQDLINYLLGMPRKTAAGAANDGRTSPEQEFSKVDDDKSIQRATILLKNPELVPEFEASILVKDLNSAADALRTLFAETVSGPAWERGKALLDPRQPLPDASPRCVTPTVNTPHFDSIREYLWHYFSHFDDYDQISFPILFGTDVGESDIVEIIRISPEDAKSLIDEREEGLKTNGRRKLAGTALHHFGAFLDPVWRQNDILWGRLDGAERLITTMLPDQDDKLVREALITEAHSSILIEELTPPSRAAVSTLLADALVQISAGVPIKTAVAQVLRPLRSPQDKSRLETIMRASLENEQLLAFIRSDYEVNRQLDAKLMLRSISRSTQVIGKMFEDMAHQNNLEGRRLAWIARLGQVFWGLVEVAVPGSILNLFFFHWLKLLYAFEVILVLAAIPLGSPEVRTFAFTALGLTVVLNIIVLLLGDYMRRRKVWWHVLIAILLVVLGFFATMGLSDLWDWGLKARLISWMHIAWGWASRLWS